MLYDDYSENGAGADDSEKAIKSKKQYIQDMENKENYYREQIRLIDHQQDVDLEKVKHLAEIAKYSGDGSRTYGLNMVMNSIEDQNDLEIERIRRIADKNKVKIREQVKNDYKLEKKALEKKMKEKEKQAKQTKTEKKLALLKKLKIDSDASSSDSGSKSESSDEEKIDFDRSKEYGDLDEISLNTIQEIYHADEYPSPDIFKAKK